MSQQRLFQFVTNLLPDWRKTRRRVLALGVRGLVKRRRLTLTGIARGVDSRTRVIHRVKRIWRFLSNRAIDPRTVVGALVREAFALRGTGWVPIIFDETGLKDRAMLLGAVRTPGQCFSGAKRCPSPPSRLRHRFSLPHPDDPKPLDYPRLLLQKRHPGSSSGDFSYTVHL